MNARRFGVGVGDAGVSLLMAGSVARLAAAALPIALLWLAVAWALKEAA